MGNNILLRERKILRIKGVGVRRIDIIPSQGHPYCPADIVRYTYSYSDIAIVLLKPVICMHAK